VVLGQSSLARPGQLLQAPTPTGLVVGGQRRRGGRRIKCSWVKAEFERKEMQQDGKTTEEHSCLHCQRTLTGWNTRWLKNHLLNTSVQVPVEHLCARGGKVDAAEPGAEGVAAVIIFGNGLMQQRRRNSVTNAAELCS